MALGAFFLVGPILNIPGRPGRWQCFWGKQTGLLERAPGWHDFTSFLPVSDRYGLTQGLGAKSKEEQTLSVCSRKTSAQEPCQHGDCLAWALLASVLFLQWKHL